jgi:hypothetical protein
MDSGVQNKEKSWPVLTSLPICTSACCTFFSLWGMLPCTFPIAISSIQNHCEGCSRWRCGNFDTCLFWNYVSTYTVLIEVDTGIVFSNFPFIFFCLLMRLALLPDTNLGNIFPLYLLPSNIDNVLCWNKGSSNSIYSWHLRATQLYIKGTTHSDFTQTDVYNTCQIHIYARARKHTHIQMQSKTSRDIFNASNITMQHVLAK